MWNTPHCFPRGCTNLHSHQRCTRFPFLYILPKTFVFLVLAMLMGVRCYLTVVLICISLVVSDAGRVSTCLLSICVSSLKKCLFRSPAYCLIELLLVAWVLYTFWILVPDQRYEWNTFSPFLGCLSFCWLPLLYVQHLSVFETIIPCHSF